MAGLHGPTAKEQGHVDAEEIAAKRRATQPVPYGTFEDGVEVRARTSKTIPLSSV